MSEPIAKTTDYPTSHAQRRLWLLEHMVGASGAYHLASAHIMEGPLDIDVFRQALHQLAMRHESLRTTFTTIDDQIAQRIHPAAIHQLREQDWRKFEEEDLQRRAEEEAAQPFDLEKGPLMRALMADLGSDRRLFMLTIHHIVTDGVSQSIIVRDLAELYRAACGNEEPKLPRLELQYKDYAGWQQQQLHQLGKEEDTNWWRGQLEQPLPMLELPYDAPRPAVKTYNGDWVFRHLPEPLMERLIKAAPEVSLFTLLVALSKTFLYRYTGQEDIIIGCAVAGRDHPALEDQVGCFINTLALRDRIDGAAGFHEILEGVRETVTESFARQRIPFDDLVSILAPERDPGRSPFFDVMVQYHNQDQISPALDQVTLEPFSTNFNPAKFDLTIDFVREPEGMRLGFFYNTDLFRKETMQRMCLHFTQLIHSIAEYQTRPIRDLEMLSAAEHRALVDWNRTDAAWPRKATLVSLFREQVNRLGDNPAVHYEYVEDKVTTLTYGQLAHLAGRVSALLQSRQAAGERVAVMLYRNEQIPAVLLGIMEAGAAYVPIDPDYPEDRIQHILADSGCRYAISEQSLASKLTEACARIEIFNLSQLPPDPAPPVPIHPQAPAYVIYTSGSTGKPKGCVITHANAVRLFVNDRFPFAFTEQDVWVCAHSFCFDYTVWETFSSLLHGCRLVIARPDQIRDIALYHKLLRDHQVTAIGLTPGVFYNLIDYESERETPSLGHLRTIFLGGDRLETAHLAPWVERYPLSSNALINLYGITETTVILTYKYLLPGDIRRTGPDSPIGGPMPETTAYVCNGTSLQPVGLAGELYVGGTGIGTGYLGRPDLTAQRFLPDPFAGEHEAGARLYKTGDLVRRSKDGQLMFLGRNDHQVQVRGFRIETGEIEARLLECEGVEKAAVVGHETNSGHTELIAYFTGHSADPDAVRTQLGGKLPEYMIPTRWMRLESMPLSPNGKLDRKALPDPHVTPVAREDQPRNDLQKVLCGLFRELLEVSAVGVNDTFFDLGGDSLTASRMTTRLQSWYGCELGVLDIFENPTVGFLAELLEERSPGSVTKISSVLLKMQGMSREEKVAFLKSRKATASQ